MPITKYNWVKGAQWSQKIVVVKELWRCRSTDGFVVTIGRSP